MPAFDAETTDFSAGNAILLAELCRAAYLDQVSARAATLQLGLTGFIWIGQMIHFDSSGKPELHSSQWNSFLSRTFQSFKEFFDIAGHAQGDVADHDMGGYANLVNARRIDLEQLFQ
jgi:hypothetical protein